MSLDLAHRLNISKQNNSKIALSKKILYIYTTYY